MIVIENSFEMGSMIFLKTDPDQRQRQITQIAVGVNGSIRYCIACGNSESWHFEAELTVEKNILVTLNDH